MSTKSRAAASLLFGVAALIWLRDFSARLHGAQEGSQPSVRAPNEIADAGLLGNLIQQLADQSYVQREAAHNRLAAIGEPAWDLLYKSSLERVDPERGHRVNQLLRTIGKSLFTEVRRFEGHEGNNNQWVTRVAVTPDGKRVVSVGSDAVRLWDIATGDQVVTFDARKGACWALAMSADGTRLITGSDTKQAIVFDLATGKVVQKLFGYAGPVLGVALTADGKQAVTGGFDRSIRVWDIDSGRELRTFVGVVDSLRCLALSPDGKLVAAGHFGGSLEPAAIRLWDFATGREMRAMHGHNMEITGIAFSPDGTMVATSSFDRSVRLWDVATGKELRRFDGHTDRAEHVAFTPDGKRVLSSGNAWNSSLRLWDIATGKQLLETAETKEGLWGVAVHPDGRHCVSAGGDKIVRLWQWKR